MVFKSSSTILTTYGHHFGFKKIAENEVVQYYRTKQSNAYVMLLNVSKAFDRDEYVKHFK